MVGLNSTIESNKVLAWLVSNASLRSPTVITLRTSDPEVIKNNALAQNMILGNGYGAWKDTTLRIANFPAVDDIQFQILLKWISTL